MNRTGLFLTVGLMILFAQKAMADVNQPSPAEINRLTVQIIDSNPQFSNPNVVYPGDTVRLVEDGEATIYTIGKWSRHAKDGCLWQIAASHLLKNRARVEVKAVIAENPEQSEVESVSVESQDYSDLQAVAKEISGLETKIIPKRIAVQTADIQISKSDATVHNHLMLKVIIGILALALSVFLFHYLKKFREDTAKNPDKYPPVIPNGLPKDLSNAFAQIATNYPRLISNDDSDLEPKQLGTISRGKVFRHFGAEKIEVLMAFEDGIRRIRVLNGDLVHCVTFSDGSVYYFRSHCGNLYVLDNRERFHFPEGWGYVPEATTNRIEDKSIS